MTFPDNSAERAGASEAGGQLMGLFWMLKLASPLPPAVEPGVAASFTRAGTADSADLAAAMGLDDTEPVFRRFARGCQASIARVEGRLASYGWITFDREDIGSLGLSVRLLPGVLGASESLTTESFEAGLLEYPQFTKPRDWQGRSIPDVLLSGDHKKIEEWRQQQAERLTADRRPDLLPSRGRNRT